MEEYKLTKIQRYSVRNLDYLVLITLSIVALSCILDERSTFANLRVKFFKIQSCLRCYRKFPMKLINSLPQAHFLPFIGCLTEMTINQAHKLVNSPKNKKDLRRQSSIASGKTLPLVALGVITSSVLFRSYVHETEGDENERERKEEFRAANFTQFE